MRRLDTAIGASSSFSLKWVFRGSLYTAITKTSASDSPMRLFYYLIKYFYPAPKPVGSSPKCRKNTIFRSRRQFMMFVHRGRPKCSVCCRKSQKLVYSNTAAVTEYNATLYYVIRLIRRTYLIRSFIYIVDFLISISNPRTVSRDVSLPSSISSSREAAVEPRSLARKFNAVIGGEYISRYMLL